MRTARDRLETMCVELVLFTVWPRAAVVLDPFVGRPPRRVLRNVLLWAAWLFAMREWIGPRGQAAAERQERALEDLAARLGRKPTRDEILEDYGARRRRARARGERRRARGR